MLVALTAGAASAWMVVSYVSHHGAQPAPVPMGSVVVAAVDVPLASKLGPDMLKVVEWPAGAQPQGSFDRVDLLSGRVTGAALVAGEPVVEARLSAKGAAPGMASLIPANMRAMTVPVNEVIGVGGFIHPGDVVDVITTMQEPTAGANGQPEYRSKIVLQNIRVLATGQQLAADSTKPETVPAVTLLVSPEQAERLALASTQGKLQLTMRAQTDEQSEETPGISPRELLGANRPAPAPPAAAPERVRHVVNHPPAAPSAAPAPSAAVEVVEVLHGDRVEQRKVSPDQKKIATKAAP